MYRKLAITVTSVLLILNIGCKSGPNAASTADSIYYNGDIITLNDAQPSAEAVAIKDGKILMVGSRAEVERDYKGAGTVMVDLAGKTLTSSFIDPHSHFSDSLSMADRVNVSAPPVGPAKDPAEIVEELQKYARSKEAGELIIGYGYDENLMPKGQHLTRDMHLRNTSRKKTAGYWMRSVHSQALLVRYWTSQLKIGACREWAGAPLVSLTALTQADNINRLI